MNHYNRDELYQEDINKIVCVLCDTLKDELNTFNIDLSDADEDVFFSLLQEYMDKYSLGYRNHN